MGKGNEEKVAGGGKSDRGTVDKETGRRGQEDSKGNLMRELGERENMRPDIKFNRYGNRTHRNDLKEFIKSVQKNRPFGEKRTITYIYFRNCVKEHVVSVLSEVSSNIVKPPITVLFFYIHTNTHRT